MMKRIIYGLFAVVLIGSLVTLSLPRGNSSVQEEFPATEGGTVNLYGIDPLTLDPAVSGDATSHEYIVQLFSGLVRLGDDMEPVPDVAERWEISEDGRTYTGKACVQSVRDLGGGRTRYGLHCVRYLEAKGTLAEGLQRASMRIQREQLRRLAGSA